MFAVMPSYPVFNDFSYQPTRSSPLSSSSPIRASSPPPAPLSPCDYNRQPRQVQSSPVQAPPSKFKFSARPARPNPVVRNREATQQSRRNLFLKGVQQRADDHRWERRGVEHKVLSTEWFNETQARQQAKLLDPDSLLTEEDIEDAERLEEERQSRYEEIPDDLMMDSMMEDEHEFEALASNVQQQQAPSSGTTRPDSPHLSDDEDYDSLFMDFLSTQNQRTAPASSGDVEMS
ncbi:hypothetical protein MCOR27_001241 [Pyricularia oryzae]|uniref:Uncharacterized protein n=1 Tax=Pyricularia grisea TaxID=148305 RepID=A0ABQ8NH31_PYRGI|nr:hypothetical protein MCOR01_007079 [Pyricularia oryzae]KAI6296862.1 hypothetical protein MCOR33_006663 [Pyricularia grisea]KAI6256994.1 hypothetical protein MCOR19_006573 [Pyricularia oryzae]KAI6273428.1 hypothetical protein MCOR26_006902 [Pyricularia oryzae]KAI6287670.1 hypothetical protein MCOR27_001241 [Pyricularia oryzae]